MRTRSPRRSRARASAPRAFWLSTSLLLVPGCDGQDAARAREPDASVDAAAPELDEEDTGKEPEEDAAREAGAPGDAHADAAPDAASAAPPPIALGEPLAPVQLAARAAQDYDENQRGLITAATLRAWLDDWDRARPAAIAGDLVIVQLQPVAGDAPFARGSGGEAGAGGARVRVYDGADLELLVAPRSNGLVAVGSAPAQGLRVDAWLRKYRVRPDHDFVLLSAGEPSPSALDTLARAWLSLRYWGLSDAGLGILDGALSAALPPERRTAGAELPPYDGAQRLTSLHNDHFAILADVGAVHAALGRDTLVDTRAAEEYAGTALGTSSRDDTCLRGPPHCTPVFSGRIAGAVHLPWSALVDPERAGFRSLAVIDHALRAAGISAERTAIVYDGDGHGSATVTFALLALAGVPARWYGPSFVEWSALSATHPEPALRLLPETSPLRGDLFPERTQGELRWAPADSAVRPLLLDALTTSDRVQEVDRFYKRYPPALPPVGEGGNLCL